MDQLYIEDGYYESGYTAYIVDATSTISVSVSITCDAELANVITVTASVDSQISITISRIREFDITASSSFDVACDYIRYVGGETGLDSFFTTNISSIRGRDAVSTIQTAFVLDIIPTKIQSLSEELASTTSIYAKLTQYGDVLIDINGMFVLGCDAISKRSTHAIINTSTGIVVDNYVIRTNNIITSAEATLIADVTKTHNSIIDLDPALFSNITIDIVGSVTRSADAILRIDTTLLARTTSLALGLHIYKIKAEPRIYIVER